MTPSSRLLLETRFACFSQDRPMLWIECYYLPELVAILFPVCCALQGENGP